MDCSYNYTLYKSLFHSVPEIIFSTSLLALSKSSLAFCGLDEIGGLNRLLAFFLGAFSAGINVGVYDAERSV
jgi:hypothetical protein